jgi:hypothetical protein
MESSGCRNRRHQPYALSRSQHQADRQRVSLGTGLVTAGRPASERNRLSYGGFVGPVPDGVASTYSLQLDPPSGTAKGNLRIAPVGLVDGIKRREPMRALIAVIDTNNFHSSLGKHHRSGLPAFMRSPGIFHRALARSNSQPRASTTSLALPAHKIVNSKNPCTHTCACTELFHQRRSDKARTLCVSWTLPAVDARCARNNRCLAAVCRENRKAGRG